MDAESWYASPHHVRIGRCADHRHRRPVRADAPGQPDHRERWSLPGGILEQGEPPTWAASAGRGGLACCRRRPLLAVELDGSEGDRPKPIISFIFDGGVLGRPGGIGSRRKNSTTGGSPIRLNSASICHPLPSRGGGRMAAASPASRRTSPSRSRGLSAAPPGLAGRDRRQRPSPVGRAHCLFEGAAVGSLRLRRGFTGAEYLFMRSRLRRISHVSEPAPAVPSARWFRARRRGRRPLALASDLVGSGRDAGGPGHHRRARPVRADV